MRNILLTLSTALLLATAQAQHVVSSQVPAAVKATVQTKFPAAKAAKWERDAANFEVGFQLNDKTMSAMITPAGEVRETETVMAPDCQPQYELRWRATTKPPK